MGSLFLAVNKPINAVLLAFEWAVMQQVSARRNGFWAGFVND